MKSTFLFISAVALGVALLTPLSNAQVTLLDTVYTPPGYVDGDKIATIFMPDPSRARGIGIVLSHGMGATRFGHRVWCDTLAARGYVAMTIDYDDINTSGGLYPKPVRAFKTAVQFLRRNAARFGITHDKIVAWGQSQGSIVWGQTIIWPNHHSYFGTDPGVNDSVDAAILLYGAYDMSWPVDILTTYFSSDPAMRTTKGNCIANVARMSTPALLLHSTLDPVVPVYQSRMLHDSLTAHGVTNSLIAFDASAYPVGVRRHAFDETEAAQFSSLGLVAKDSALAFLGQVFQLSEVKGVADRIPTAFRVEHNYPNPFNPTTAIEYALPHSGYVTLTIYNVLGEEVATLVDVEQATGIYKTTWDASGMPSGVYFYRLAAGEYVQTRRMVLMR